MGGLGGFSAREGDKPVLIIPSKIFHRIGTCLLMRPCVRRIDGRGAQLKKFPDSLGVLILIVPIPAMKIRSLL